MTKSFEKSMEALETTVKKLQDGKLSLDESIAEFERGMALVKECRESLTSAKQRVTRILENGEEAAFGENTDEK